MKVRKTRIRTKVVMCYNSYSGIYYKFASKIQVRILGIWFTISVVVDDDETYSIERAKEIEGYLDAD